jgi:hypothetical protein
LNFTTTGIFGVAMQQPIFFSMFFVHVSIQIQLQFENFLAVVADRFNRGAGVGSGRFNQIVEFFTASLTV